MSLGTVGHVIGFGPCPCTLHQSLHQPIDVLHQALPLISCQQNEQCSRCTSTILQDGRWHQQWPRASPRRTLIHFGAIKKPQRHYGLRLLQKYQNNREGAAVELDLSEAEEKVYLGGYRNRKTGEQYCSFWTSKFCCECEPANTVTPQELPIITAPLRQRSAVGLTLYSSTNLHIHCRCEATLAYLKVCF